MCLWLVVYKECGVQWDIVVAQYVFLTNSVHLRVCVCVCAVLGKVRSAVGSAQLLMSQKFQQFRGLCEQNLVSLPLILSIVSQTHTFFCMLLFSKDTWRTFFTCVKIQYGLRVI